MLHARVSAHRTSPARGRRRGALAALALLAIGAAQASDALGPWTPLTLGGEGGMFAQAISPVDANLMMVTCDMGASYVTRDGGKTWSIIDCRQLGFMGGAAACPPVFHPTDASTIYAYGQKNGGQPSLLITHDKGATWSVQSSAWGGAQITALYQDRGDPSLMLAGVNGAIAYSTDEGRTWTNASGFSGNAVRFFIDWRSSSTSRTCYAGADSGAWRSTDGGRTWSAFDGGLGTTNLRSFTGGANASTLTLMATDVDFGVWRSINGGAWAAVGSAPTSAQPWQVSMAEIDPSIVYLTTNNGVFETTTTMLYKSVDGGNTWDPGVYQFHVGSGNVEWSWETFDRPAHRWDDGTLVRNLMVSQTDPNSVIAGDWARCVTTHDGGASWQQMTSTFADTGTPAAGMKWKSNGLNVTCSWFYQISPQNPQFHYVGFSDIALLRSEDGGQTWYYGAIGDPWDNTVYQLAFDPNVAGTMWAACSQQHDIQMWGGDAGPKLPGGICISTDYGRTWTAQRTGLPSDSQNVPCVSVIVDPTDQSLYAAFYGDWIYHSTDKGNSWTRCACSGLYSGTNNNHNLWKIVAHADGTMFAMVEGKLVQNSSGWDFPDPGAVFRSRDHGATWTNITTNVVGGLPLYNPQGFAVDPSNSAIVYIAASNGKYPHLQSGFYKTTDGGATWTNPAGPWNDAFNAAVQVDPTDRSTVYFLGDSGVFVSHDQGATWADQVPTAPYTNCHGIAVDHGANALYLATVGVGGIRGTLVPVSISTPSVTNVSAGGATIAWTTDVATTSQLDYGTTTGYGSQTALDGNRVTGHSVTLSGLASGTLYHVRARSADGSGALALSGDVVFTTGSGQTATAPSITAQPAGVTVIAGQTATFSVGATGTAPLTYQWRRNGAAIAGATGASYTTAATTTADSGAVFSVVVSNGAGSVASANATLTVNAAVATPYGGTARAIPGQIEAEDFDDGGEGLAYHDSDAGNNGGAYRSTDVDIRASIDAGGGYQVGWFGAGEWMQYTCNAAAAGVFTASVRGANGDVGGTLHIAIDGVDVTGAIAFANTGGWDTFQTIGHAGIAISAGRHAVRLYCDTGAADVNWIAFAATPPPSISAQPTGATVTAPQTATFSVGATGTGALSYQWRRNGATIAGATAATYTTPATSTADSGAVFTVVVSDVAGSTTSSSATLTVNPAPIAPPSITAQPAGVTVTAGQTATFSVSATGAGTLTYQWRRNGTAIAGATGASYTTPTTSTADSGAVFSVVVGNAGGSVTSANATLTVNPAPIAPPSITAQPTDVAVSAGQTATFTVAASGAGTLTYQWQRNGAAIAGATGASYTTPATTTADSGAVFDVVVGDAGGSVASANATLIVNASTAPVATPYGGVARAIPGQIEAEDFDDGGEGVAYHDRDLGNDGGAYRSTDVDIRTSIDSNGGGFQVGWFGGDEWMQYTTDAADAGSYTLTVRISNGDVGGTFHVTIDGVDVTGPLTTANTGGWDSFVTLSHGGIAIASGRHAVRIVSDSGAVDVNWFAFAAETTTSTGTPSGGTTTPPPPTTSVTGSTGSGGGCGRGAGLIAVGLALFLTGRSRQRWN